MPADPLRAVPGHQADDQPAGHRHQHRREAELIGGRGDEVSGEAVVVDQVGDGPISQTSAYADQRAEHPDGGRHRGEDEEPAVGGEVAQAVLASGGGRRSDAGGIVSSSSRTRARPPRHLDAPLRVRGRLQARLMGFEQIASVMIPITRTAFRAITGRRPTFSRTMWSAASRSVLSG